MDRFDHQDMHGVNHCAVAESERGATSPEADSQARSRAAVLPDDVIPESVPHDGRRGLRGWNPTRRPPRHTPREVPYRLRHPMHLDGASDPADWTLIDIRVANGLGHVRSGMTYNKEYGTSCSLYEKPGRLQFMEGPNEPAVADHLELSPRYLDFQLQGIDMVFRRADGRIIHKYPDALIEFDDNTVRPAEIKTSREWFDAPGVSRPLAAVEAGLSSKGFLPLLRIRGEVFRREETLEAHRRAFAARLTNFDREADVAAVRATVLAAGGSASHGSLVAALGGDRQDAEGKLYAMLMRRFVAFDLWAQPAYRCVDCSRAVPARSRGPLAWSGCCTGRWRYAPWTAPSLSATCCWIRMVWRRSPRPVKSLFGTSSGSIAFRCATPTRCWALPRRRPWPRSARRGSRSAREDAGKASAGFKSSSWRPRSHSPAKWPSISPKPRSRRSTTCRAAALPGRMAPGPARR